MTNNLVKRILNGDVRALASLMSLIEDGDPKVKAVLKAIYTYAGRAHVTGVTSAAGTGKSTVIDRTTAEYRRRRKTVGILAVDPTSLFSTGAVLGDRVDARPFCRRWCFHPELRHPRKQWRRVGCCSKSHPSARCRGKDVIFVETIGVGQDQLEIAALAQMVVVVLTPQMGDEVQGMKAGLAEIADILVVNKADLSGADETVQQLTALFADEDFLILATSKRLRIRELICSWTASKSTGR